MKDLGHGANVCDMANMYNKDPKEIIDFSSNINPKVIQGLESYILEGLKECRSYPDINYTNLRSNISKYIGVKPEFIIPGNGATEIIYLLMKSIDSRLAILNPTFSEYGRSARLNDLEVVNLSLDKENNFEIDINIIKENIGKFDSLFICNPNNPNGKVQDLTDLLNLMVENKKLLIVDETFMEFVGDEDKYSLVKYIERYENIFILKAVTKFFGMPGLRLGYGLTSNKKIIDKIYNYKEPWTINSFADNLSNYIFNDKKYIEDSKNYYIKERKYMLDELKIINNIVVYDTDTNFVLIKLKNRKANELKDQLFKEASILIRDASNFIELDNSFIRIAIKSHEENTILIKHMKKILGD
ncbi:histidinol-phosphate transaminase [Clostridium sp. CCUG 7971]|uniref:pyridoxal phosphate-dependent aminotransferase n=1 Tax=Clostridium sp. CCUG 7971 TaxID=2811414 RepID=UPI001ABB9653|nr:histidinol-phosphate transaminase [Clostridium sp. CCUG 7971]MBO3445020.1 aminotransferase class I/II-fold pyridoxal phosphate-dependent enzyme [Clostridium sp. CCUG 7971]